MTQTAQSLEDYEGITQTIQHYLAGAKSGKGDDMKPGFHEDATICGFIGEDLFAGPIQLLFDWNDDNGPATELKANIVSINLEQTAATARVEIDNWTSHRFTDMFTLVKFSDNWKIVSKVFHFHTQ